jgi:hypothetical protein
MTTTTDTTTTPEIAQLANERTPATLRAILTSLNGVGETTVGKLLDELKLDAAAAPKPAQIKRAKQPNAELKGAALARWVITGRDAKPKPKAEPKPKAKAAKTSTPRISVAKTSDETPTAIMNRASKAAVKEHADAARYPRKSRKSGTTVALFDNRERQLIDHDSKWFTVCLDHGALLPATSIGVADDWMPHADRWCPGCQAAAVAAAASTETDS